MPGIPLPGVVSVAQFVPPVGEPSYSKIFNDTMGNLATPADGMDKALADLGAVADALNGEMVAESAIDNLGTAIGILPAVDLTSLDTHIGNYEAAMPDGSQVVADSSNSAPPFLYELPITPNFIPGISAPPVQVSQDLGTMKLGSKPLVLELGGWFFDPHRGDLGQLYDVLASGDPAIYHLSTTYQVDRHNYPISGKNYLNVTPAKVGTFVAQVNLLPGPNGAITLVTYTVTVTQ
jgi:hypothetical protein